MLERRAGWTWESQTFCCSHVFCRLHAFCVHRAHAASHFTILRACDLVVDRLVRGPVEAHGTVFVGGDGAPSALPCGVEDAPRRRAWAVEAERQAHRLQPDRRAASSPAWPTVSCAPRAGSRRRKKRGEGRIGRGGGGHISGAGENEEQVRVARYDAARTLPNRPFPIFSFPAAPRPPAAGRTSRRPRPSGARRARPSS